MTSATADDVRRALTGVIDPEIRRPITELNMVRDIAFEGAAAVRLSARYDTRFRRMWRFYLAASMATFRERQCQLWQLVLSPQGLPGGYVAPR